MYARARKCKVSMVSKPEKGAVAEQSDRHLHFAAWRRGHVGGRSLGKAGKFESLKTKSRSIFALDSRATSFHVPRLLILTSAPLPAVTRLGQSAAEYRGTRSRNCSHDDDVTRTRCKLNTTYRDSRKRRGEGGEDDSSKVRGSESSPPRSVGEYQ